MKTILIPTDLSAQTPALITSACHLIQQHEQHEAKIILLHVYQLDHDLVSMHTRLITNDWKQQEMEKKNILLGFIKEVPVELKKSIPIEVQLVIGHSVREIIYLAKKESPDIILMPTGGGSPNTKVREVMRKAPCPVLVIPTGVSLAQKAELIYVTHLNQEGKRIMDKLIKLARNSALKLRCLYVPAELQHDVSVQFAEAYEDELKHEILKIITVSPSHLKHQLNELGRNQKSKLWVVPIRNQPWWLWWEKTHLISDYMPARSAFYALK